MRKRHLFIGFAAFFICSAEATAQTTGDILGRVTDASETPLRGVTIEATSPSLPGARLTATDEKGLYRVPSVPPGAYRVRATLSGFRSVEKTCSVALGSAMTVDLTLRIEAKEQVLVSGEAPPIDTSTTTTGTNYAADVISRLPVDRNYADIVRANPGVSTDVGETQGRFLPLTIYGATSAENQWIIDGVNTTNVGAGIQGKAINTEFIQEVEVKTGGYPAEYSRAFGGVINVITKSGGNAFHGDGFFYFDSKETTAERRVGPDDSGLGAMRLLDAKRFDYGADLGGFVVKDRLWFFGAYNRIASYSESSRVAPSRHVSTDERFPSDAVGDLYSGKITWNATTSTAAVGTVFADPLSTVGFAGAPVSLDTLTWRRTLTQGGTDYGVRLTQLFGWRALATSQGSYHQDRITPGEAGGIRYADQTCVGGSRERRCAFPPEANAIWGGVGLISGSESVRTQVSASLNLFENSHDLRMGADYMDGQTDEWNRYTGGQMVWLRNEWGQEYYFHRYYAVSRTDPTPVGGDQRHAQVLDYGAYLQDSWRAASGLTVNAGVRWDGEATRNYFGDTVLRFDTWQPRLGLAWDPWRDGRTKVQVFAGRFSSALPTAAAATAFGRLSLLGVFNFDPLSVVQDPNVFRHGSRLGGGGEFREPVDAGVKAPYQDELTVGVERSLSPSLTVGLKGTYRRVGRALEDRCDFDYTNPDYDLPECAFINPGSDGPFASGNVPTCDGLWDSEAGNQCSPTGPATPEAQRVYRGIEVIARHSIPDGLWIQASYTYSSLRGNYDGGVDQTFLQTRPGLAWSFNKPAFWHNGYGALALDRPHRFRFDGWWVTPLSLGVGLQAFVESGAPLNKLGYFTSYGPSVHLVPRGSAGRLPTLWEANLTLSYPIAIGPVTATLQGYVYNVFNNQIATSRDQGWTTSPPEGFAATIYDPDQEQNNPNYGKVTSRSAPRSFRAALKFSL